jgi:hypothetical protein
MELLQPCHRRHCVPCGKVYSVGTARPKCNMPDDELAVQLAPKVFNKVCKVLCAMRNPLVQLYFQSEALRSFQAIT